MVVLEINLALLSFSSVRRDHKFSLTIPINFRMYPAIYTKISCGSHLKVDPKVLCLFRYIRIFLLSEMERIDRVELIDCFTETPISQQSKLRSWKRVCLRICWILLSEINLVCLG